jgi:hypothetical protein
VDAKPEWRVLDPRHGEPRGQRKHSCNPREPGTKAPRSGARDEPLALPFPATTDTVRNTTKELCSTATQYITNNAATQLHPAPHNDRETSSDITVQDAGEGTKGGRKPWPATSETIIKRAALSWRALCLSQATVSARRGLPQTTLRSSLRRLVQTTPTPSSTSLEITT